MPETNPMKGSILDNAINMMTNRDEKAAPETVKRHVTGMDFPDWMSSAR